MTSTESIDAILARVVEQIAPVRGVRAIALGGSRARGWNHAKSDIDIGLYYSGDLDIAALNRAATALDDAHREGLATERGGWGGWVDGGAWLTIDGVAVDLLYRDLARVDRVIADVQRGVFEIAYHVGHPHAYVSAAHAGELAISRPLHDPEGLIAARKAQLAPYPPALQKELIARFLGEARFTLLLVEKGEVAQDVTYTEGAAFRVVACLNQAIFALNREWLINEKGAVKRAAAMTVAPRNYALRAVERPELAALVSETEALASQL
jgi:predicted nucleotidyltransferase